MVPVTIDELQAHYRGDVWKGLLGFGPITINGVPPATTLVSCRMQFRDREKLLGYELNTSPAAGEGTLVIDNSTTWVISIPKQLLPLEVGKWYWDIETIDSEGFPWTPFRGSIKVQEDVSHD